MPFRLCSSLSSHRRSLPSLQVGGDRWLDTSSARGSGALQGAGGGLHKLALRPINRLARWRRWRRARLRWRQPEGESRADRVGAEGGGAHAETSLRTAQTSLRETPPRPPLKGMTRHKRRACTWYVVHASCFCASAAAFRMWSTDDRYRRRASRITYTTAVAHRHAVSPRDGRVRAMRGRREGPGGSRAHQQTAREL